MKAIFSFFLIMNCILIFSQKNWKLRFYNETIEKNVKIFADNDEEAPVSVVFDFKLDNMASNLSNGQVVVIPEKTKQVLIASLNVVNPTKKYGFQYTNSYNFGNVLQGGRGEASPLFLHKKRGYLAPFFFSRWSIHLCCFSS